MRHDEFEQHERAAGDIIHAIGRASDDIRVPPDFRAQVMAKAEPLTSPRPAHLHWRSMALTWDVSEAVEGCHGAGLCSRAGRCDPAVCHLVQSLYRGGFPRRRCTRRLSKKGYGKRISPAPLNSTRIPRITRPSRVTTCTSWYGPVLRATCSSPRSHRRKPPHHAASGYRWPLRRAAQVPGRHWSGRPLPPPSARPQAGGWPASPRFCVRNGLATNASCAGSDSRMVVAGTRSSTREQAGWCEVVRRPATRSASAGKAGVLTACFLSQTDGSTYGVSGTTAAHFR